MTINTNPDLKTTLCPYAVTWH